MIAAAPARASESRTPERSQVVLLVATIARTLLSLAITILLGRYLPAAEFGFFALVGSVFGLAHEFTDMGSGNVAVRDVAREPKSERHMLEQLLGLRLGLSLIAAAACVVLGFWQDSPLHQGIIFATAAVLALSYLSALGTVFLVRQAQMAPSLLNVLAQLGTLVVCAALLGLKAAGALFAIIVLVRELGIVVGLRWLAIRVLGYSPRARFDRKASGAFFGKAAIVAMATLFYHLQFQGGMFFIEFMRPASELGAFAAAFRPLNPFLFLPWLLMLPIVPFLSWLAGGRRAEFRRQAQGILSLSIGVGAVAAAASSQMAQPLMELLYGAKFSAGPLSAVTTLQWLSLALGCSFVAAAISTVLLADNRENQLLYLSAVSLMVYVIANFVLLPRLGFTGGAIATALAVSLMTVGGLILLWKAGGVDAGLQAPILLAPATALFAALHFLSAPVIVELVMGSVLSFAALIGVFYLPTIRRYRAEQRRLSDLLHHDHKGLEGAAAAHG